MRPAPANATINSPLTAFFPTNPGATWEFEETRTSGRDRRTILFTDRVKGIVLVDDEPALQIETVSHRLGGSQTESTFYRLTQDAVYILGYSPTDLVSNPYPILKSPERNTTWRHSGTIVTGGDQVPMLMSATLRRTGIRNVLGQRRETVEVVKKFDIQYLPSVVVTSTQTSRYAEGIGLYEFREEGRSGETRVRRVRVLKDFSPGQPRR